MFICIRTRTISVEKLSDMEYGYDTDVDLEDLLSSMDLDEDDELELYERNKILDAIEEVQGTSASHRDDAGMVDFFSGMPDDLGFDLKDL